MKIGNIEVDCKNIRAANIENGIYSLSGHVYSEGNGVIRDHEDRNKAHLHILNENDIVPIMGWAPYTHSIGLETAIWRVLVIQK